MFLPGGRGKKYEVADAASVGSDAGSIRHENLRHNT